MAFCNLKSKYSIKQAPAIVFSTSLEVRNYLRNLVSECDLNAVCFENEAICFDNFNSIQPQIIIVESSVADIVWRFIFALHTIDANIPMIILSDHLKTYPFRSKEMLLEIYTMGMNHCKNRLLSLIERLTHKRNTAMQHRSQPSFFVGRTKAINKIRSILPTIRDVSDPVLISGEQGTGKELLARVIVDFISEKPDFIKINCSKLLPEMLFNRGPQDALGLGKNQDKPTTFFLDHVHQLSTACQAGMFLLMEALFKSGNGTGQSDNNKIRFIAASDQKVEGLVRQGKFRKDLFYSLNVIPIEMPPLRERKKDIPLLMDYFMISACVQNQKCIMIPSQQAREICYMYHWPGNVTELKNQMTRIVKAGSESHLLSYAGSPRGNLNLRENLWNRFSVEELPKSHEIKDYLPGIKNMSLKGICDEFVVKTERRLMKRALESTSWNRKKAAKLLNISYKSMLNKIKTYDII